VGVGLINYFEWRGSPVEQATNRAAYEETMISLVEWLLEEGHPVRLLTGDVWDDPCLERVLEAVRARHPDLDPDLLMGDPARDLHQLMNQIGDVEVVIGARYHNIVSALRLAKPVLALSYAPKAQQVMEQFGLSTFSHPINGIDLPRLKDQFGELYRQRAEVGRQLRTQVAKAESELEAQREQFVNELLLAC
jgi:polysaccharide pyruvyl transferase WcaK-like protein